MTQPDLPALALALQNLFDTYRTDADDAERATLTLEAGGQQHVVRPQPGQVEWLARLVRDEDASFRNAHADGTGVCEHCRGLGAVGGRKPLTWIAWHVDGGHPGMPCTDAATAKAYAQEQYLAGLRSEGQDAAVLVWTGTEDLRTLKDQDKDTGWYASPETVRTPSDVWTCTWCGEGNDNTFARCPGCSHPRPSTTDEKE
ncbi:hypothetical protein [Streptomyces niveiscabiei]|uniref:hypothetical protein n=1 Tax=Streptomyces niveiscabiei TaxID=164115 RepID=UPI0038F7F871